MRSCAVLKKGEGRTLAAGGAFVFDNEIDIIKGDIENGDVINIEAFNGYPLGTGVINTNSKIRIRLLSRKNDTVIDSEFFHRRVSDAWEYRKSTVDTSSCRLIFGEADFLPGFTADKYEDIIVIQSLSFGLDRYKEMICSAISDVLYNDGIKLRGFYERSDSRERDKEGMPRFTGFLNEPFDTDVIIQENGVKFAVDIEQGQKTGFFLDQKFNRAAVRPMCKNARVLDCFTHTGAFALNAADAGASSVLAADASAPAIEQAKKNALLNGLDGVTEFITADVFELLPQLAEKNEKFDVVILDPPAFTKSRESVKKAAAGYREINRRGMALVKNGGFLATCSCSHFMTNEMLFKEINLAASDTGKRLRQVYFGTQSPDHPILITKDSGSELSYYLKFYIFQVIDEI